MVFFRHKTPLLLTQATRVLRYWDIRLPTKAEKVRSPNSKSSPVMCSPIDPTTLHGSRRPRGIVSLAKGTGPTEGLIFGLGADCRVHTYSLPSLVAQKTQYTHENLQSNSFYVGLALSPGGEWLATGSTGKQGSCFLFDAKAAARPWVAPPGPGFELRAQLGEVGGVDWADDTLATCADDGTVRVWRPDVETYRSCQEKPEEKAWDWSWAIGGL